MGKRKKKKKSAGAVFLRGFGTSVLVICLLFLAGFASYKVSLFYFNEKGVSRDSKASDMIQELYGSVEVEDVSKNLIYSVDQESGKIKSIVLEIFNTNTKNMDYITIPVKTEFTISNELYQKLAATGCEAPQIIKLSSIYKYFSEDTLYEYGELIINDLLGIDISYYTVVEPAVFKKMFKKTEYQTAVQSADTARVQTVQMWSLSESYKNEIKAIEKEEKAVKDYIERAYESCTSNLPASSKKQYAQDYLKWNVDYTYYYVLPGIVEDTSYHALGEEAKALLSQLLTNAAYTQPQNIENIRTTQSKDCIIQILNASQINGLAAEYKETLEEQGYTVDSVGNYTGQVQTASSILVREEGTGADLLFYLKDAVVTVSETLPDGIDIQIILGTDASQ